jgi:hypothetical protein
MRAISRWRGAHWSPVEARGLGRVPTAELGHRTDVSPSRSKSGGQPSKGDSPAHAGVSRSA